MALYLNEEEVETFVFPAGECHVKVDSKKVRSLNVIHADLLSANDIFMLLLCVDAIRRIHFDAKIDLVIPYFPYARQDRATLKGEPFSLFVMTKIINDLNLNSVTILDPHSLKTEQLLKNCRVIHQDTIIQFSALFDFIQTKKLNLVAPDKGAVDKVNKLKNILNQNGYTPKVIKASKKRDLNSGKIIETIVEDPVESADYILIDDICDEGKTFTNLALKLKEKGAKNIYLYVTHGIFSKGFIPLRPHFSHVFCYHTFLKDTDNTFLTILKDVFRAEVPKA